MAYPGVLLLKARVLMLIIRAITAKNFTLIINCTVTLHFIILPLLRRKSSNFIVIHVTLVLWVFTILHLEPEARILLVILN